MTLRTESRPGSIEAPSKRQMQADAIYALKPAHLDEVNIIVIEPAKPNVI